MKPLRYVFGNMHRRIKYIYIIIYFRLPKDTIHNVVLEFMAPLVFFRYNN
jgi:hypothetical protein